MRNRVDRVEARIAPEQADRIRYAAELENSSVSGFLVSSAAARAEEVIASHTETSVPTEFFDRMLRELDEAPKIIPSLARAARRARKPDTASACG
jgi:uncharacterized protein (DUF1778 family)